MEKLRKRVKDKDTQQSLDHIIQNGMGNPIIFKTAPTKATMKANTWGLFGDDIYIRGANGEAKKLTGTNVT